MMQDIGSNKAAARLNYYKQYINNIMELYVSFPIDGFDHWKVVSYQLGYTVQDAVSDYTIIVL